jgi:hypothetical protein
MSRFAVITEDPDYYVDEDGMIVNEDELSALDPAASEAIFARIVEELSPFGTVNS